MKKLLRFFLLCLCITGSASGEKLPPVKIEFELARPGNVTLVIEDESFI